MKHRLINYCIALTILLVMVAVQQLDASDFEHEAAKERREWMAAISVCHRSYGPSTQPEYDDRGHMMCVSRRGEVLAYRGPSK